MNDLRVDVTSIERSFAELWRNEKADGAVTRAALWNVVAHTWTSEQQAYAAQVLAQASEAVPQRTIVVRASPEGADEISSWISANCHLVGGTSQVCSEEVVIEAGGERVHHVAPLVAALLLPDMPVAVWWLGDLPSEREDYVAPLLDPADRLIVDSSQFSSAHDLALVSRIADETTTAPADLNWVRLEEWRAATASMFDPPQARERLSRLRAVQVTTTGPETFGTRAEGLLYGAWLSAQLGQEIALEIVCEGETARGINAIELRFDDGPAATITRDRERGVLLSDGATFSCVTRLLGRGMHDLIVRQLKRPESDRVYVKTLRAATKMAAPVA